MQSSTFIRALLGAALCLAMTVPALADDGSLLLAAGKGKGKPQQQQAATQPTGDIQAQLDDFAQQTIASINRCVLPSAGKKEVKPSGGGFTARYIEIDPKSVKTNYKRSDSSAVSHIGYMHYDEVEYVCTGSTAKAAATGPCAPTRREKMTELVKYVNGKWTY